MADMSWWATAVRELSDDTLEQVTSGLGNTGAYVAQYPAVVDMHDMAVAELGRRSAAANVTAGRVI